MKTICWINFFVFFISQAYTQSVRSSAYYVHDKGSVISYDSIMKVPNGLFTTFNEKQKVKIGYNSGDAVWSKVIIQNNTGQNITRWIVFNNIHLDSVELFYRGKYFLRGDRTNDDEALCVAPAFELQLDTGKTELYIRIKKIHSFLNFEYEITSAQKYLPAFHFRFSAEAFAIGILFLFSIFNLFFFIASKDRIYLLYSSYSFIITLYFSVNTGFLKFTILPHFLYFSEIRIYSAFISASFLSIFIMRYLDFHVKKKKLCGIITLLSFVNLGAVIISFIPYFMGLEKILKTLILGNYLNVLAMFLFLLGGIISNLKQARIKSLYVLSVFLAFFVWGISFLLREFTPMRINFAADWLTVCAIYEALLFGILLAIKYYTTFKENNTLMQAVIFERENGLAAFAQGETLERQRLANTLHDNFGSRLSAILLFANKNALIEVKKEITTLSNDMRDLSHGIMPRSLKEGGLIAAIEKHIQIQNEANPSLNIELYHYDVSENIQEEWIYDMYLISQEIINNAVKHSAASLVTIEIFGYENDYVFQYTDNGKGFNSSLSRGHGLANIESRLIKYKAKFEINSETGKGTYIIIEIPLNQSGL